MATVVTTVGKGIITGRMLGATPSQAEPKYVAWGTGAGTAAVGDTTLFTEGPEARVSGTGSQVTTTVTNDTHQVVATITASASRTPTNVGVFDASTSGNIYVKGD
ncbi:MAG: hypothetical protein QOD63_2688, partial [Actinomycetota bacterium]|nr:hypothetical protein [Actinomycetota bacterium]